jgi:hypothetical protein
LHGFEHASGVAGAVNSHRIMATVGGVQVPSVRMNEDFCRGMSGFSRFDLLAQGGCGPEWFGGTESESSLSK